MPDQPILHFEERPDEEQRRAFWAENLNRVYDLAQVMLRYPVEESGEGFASIPQAMDDAGIECRFNQTPIVDDLPRVHFIRAGNVPALVRIARAVNDRGWILKIEDGYRSQEMQTRLGRKPEVFDQIVRSCVWENHGHMPDIELIFKRAICLVANYPATGTHMSGAAIDVSVFQQDDGAEVWRGKAYLEMSEYTPMNNPFISQQELDNRMEITRMIEAEGFMHYPGEFWHYNQGDGLCEIYRDSGKPARYGPVHWDPVRNTVTPYENPTEPFTPPEQMRVLAEQAVQRLLARQDRRS